MAEDNKKSAYQLACEELKTQECPYQKYGKELTDRCRNKDIDLCLEEDAADCWKQYFQEHATQDDGWKVVNNIYDDVLFNINSIENCLSHSQKEKEMQEAKIEILRDVACNIKSYLDRAEIGVKDENE